jgi:CheY-like chemotaxis protein
MAQLLCVNAQKLAAFGTMLRSMNIATQASVSPARTATKAPFRMLIANDSRANRMLVTAVLLRWGIVPTIACNGEQVVRLAEQQNFDFVLMDMLMPVMNGVVATARIRQFERENPSRPRVPIVAYTSLDLGTDGAQWNRVGLSAILPKPCSASSMLACLERWCPDRFVAN